MKIAIFGKTENQWGLEGLIQKHIKGMDDIKIMPLSCFNDGLFFFGGYDAICIIQGRGVNHEALQEYSGLKVLLNAEFLPYEGDGLNSESVARLKAVEPIEDFDLVLTGCPRNADWLNKNKNATAKWFPMMGVDPDFHRRIDGIEKDIDIGFYGIPSERRINLWQQINRDVQQFRSGTKISWVNGFGEDMVRFINRCKIVLNLHYAPMLNTESRIYEVLGCGTFCLSEPVSHTTLFLSDVHMGIDDGVENIVDTAEFYLREDSLRKEVAHSGMKYVHSKLSIGQYVQSLKDIVAYHVEEKAIQGESR